jgi:hypothetical protein
MPNNRKPVGNGPKRGRLSQKDIDYIQKNQGKLTTEQIAQRLSRPVSTIEKHLGDRKGNEARKAMTVSAELELRPEWRQWREQFTKDELEFFKYRYVQLMGQFRDDSILPTEEIQVFNFITLDILMQRVMKEQKKVVVELDFFQQRLEELYDQIKHLSPDDPDHEELSKKIRFCEGKYAELSSALKPISQRHESYMMRQSNMLKELKATRDQRVKVLEGSKHSFLGYLRALQEDDFREEQGDEMEKYRIATEKQRERLAAPHTYIDGSEDHPLYTPEVAEEYAHAG